MLDEGLPWKITNNTEYVLTRNDSSIIAFRTGDDLTQGINMLGAHTDSPCLRIKPNADINKHGYTQLGVEVYGGALLHPWFDRDLSIAGRVSGVNKDGSLFHEIIDFKKAIATIPNLAIHLDRDANTNKSVNKQTDLPIILGHELEGDFKSVLLQKCSDNAKSVLDYELSCYDTQAPGFVGLNDEFICSARLDNLSLIHI